MAQEPTHRRNGLALLGTLALVGGLVAAPCFSLAACCNLGGAPSAESVDHSVSGHAAASSTVVSTGTSKSPDHAAAESAPPSHCRASGEASEGEKSSPPEHVLSQKVLQKVLGDSCCDVGPAVVSILGERAPRVAQVQVPTALLPDARAAFSIEPPVADPPDARPRHRTGACLELLCVLLI